MECALMLGDNNYYELQEDINSGSADTCELCYHPYRDHQGFNGWCTYREDDDECDCTEFTR